MTSGSDAVATSDSDAAVCGGSDSPAKEGSGPAVTVVLPGQRRELADGASELSLRGSPATVGEVFQALRAGHRAIYDRIFTERGEIRPHVNVFVDGADVRWAGGLDTPVRTGSEIVVLPAVSGG